MNGHLVVAAAYSSHMWLHGSPNRRPTSERCPIGGPQVNGHRVVAAAYNSHMLAGVPRS
jgi:hypothetical protein